jgi:hypothetical protein
MKHYALAVGLSALFGFGAISSGVLAQQKTVKACTEEWRANRADNQAKGITEKAYVDDCRAGRAASPPPAQSATAPVPPVPAPAAPAKPATTAAPTTRAPAATTAPTGSNQFSTEALAKARCPTDTVVWANLNSHIYHFAGHREYGNTKSGAYMCEKDASAQSIRAAKNEKHP